MKYKLIIPTLMAAAALSLVAGDKDKTHEIVQKDKAFSDVKVTIKPGGTINFKNDDSVTHNVFSNSKSNPFKIKIQKPGESSDVKFESVGVTEVRCAIHPKMKLIVTVAE